MGKTMLQFKVQCQKIVKGGFGLPLEQKMGQSQIGWLGSMTWHGEIHAGM